jgi:hypothetical protein
LNKVGRNRQTSPQKQTHGTLTQHALRRRQYPRTIRKPFELHIGFADTLLLTYFENGLLLISPLAQQFSVDTIV